MLLKYLKSKYEPREAIKIGKAIDDFTGDFMRKLERTTSTSNPYLTAHWFLRQLRIPGPQASQVITGAGKGDQALPF